MSVHVKSMAQETHALFCDPDLIPCKADEVLEERFNVLKQQLQHQIKDECKFDIISPRLRHNLTSPCKIKINGMNNYRARNAIEIKRWKRYHQIQSSSQNNTDKTQNK